LVRRLACPDCSVRQSTATTTCRRVRRTLAYFFCLLCVLLAQSNFIVCLWSAQGIVAQRHLGPKGPFVISCPQRHLGLRLHNLVVLLSDTIWVLTPTHSIGFNDNTVHCINAYNKCYATTEVQGFFRCELVKLLNYSTTKCSAIFIVSLSTHVSTLHSIQCLNQFTER